MGFTSEENKNAEKIAEIGEDLNLLEEGLKEKLESMGREDLKAFVGKVALNELENQANKKADADLNAKKEAVKEASAVYKDATKANKAKIEYAKYLLEGMGAL